MNSVAILVGFVVVALLLLVFGIQLEFNARLAEIEKKLESKE